MSQKRRSKLQSQLDEIRASREILKEREKYLKRKREEQTLNKTERRELLTIPSRLRALAAQERILKEGERKR